MNHTAALVLELATGDLRAQGIANWIARVYSLETPPVEDVERLIDELRGEHLLLAATEVGESVTANRETVGTHYPPDLPDPGGEQRRASRRDGVVSGFLRRPRDQRPAQRVGER